MTLRAAASPPATLIFKTKDHKQSEATFSNCDHAIIAAMERLAPKERSSAFICAGRVILNYIEIARAYDTIVAT